MIVPDFPLEFAGLFPRKNFGIFREKIRYLPGNIRLKISNFFPRHTALKLHSSLFLSTFLCRNRHVPPNPAGPARPQPPSWPSTPSRPARPDPLWPSGPAPATKFFPGSVRGFSPRMRERGKKSVQKEKTHLLH